MGRQSSGEESPTAEFGILIYISIAEKLFQCNRAGDTYSNIRPQMWRAWGKEGARLEKVTKGDGSYHKI